MQNIYSPGYNSPYPQTFQYQPQNQMNNNSTSVVWVQGLAGAQAYPVAAGNTMMLMDSENPIFYMKSTDTTGRPLPLRTFNFTEVTNEPKPQQQQPDLTNYVTWEAFEKRLDEFEAKKSTTRRESTNGKSTKRNDE